MPADDQNASLPGSRPLKLAKRATLLATIHGVSTRTMRHHLAMGTMPERKRKMGRDGKSYPAGCGPCPILTELRRASWALDQATRAWQRDPLAVGPQHLIRSRTVARAAHDLARFLERQSYRNGKSGWTTHRLRS